MIIELRDPMGKKLAISMTWLYTYKSLILIIGHKDDLISLAMNIEKFTLGRKL